MNPDVGGGSSGGMSRRSAIVTMGAAAGGVVGVVGCASARGVEKAAVVAARRAAVTIEVKHGKAFQKDSIELDQATDNKDNVMMVVYEPDAQGNKRVRYVMVELSKEGTAVPDCMGQLHDAGTNPSFKIVPPPPWWRYTRGRWTHQRTSRVDIVASGTTALIFCCNVRDTEGAGTAYETEFVIVLGDAGKGSESKIKVTAHADKLVCHELVANPPAGTDDAANEAHARTLKYVRTGDDGKLMGPALVHDFIRNGKHVLTDAIVCVMKNIREKRLLTDQLNHADAPES